MPDEARELLEDDEITASSGVTVRVLPFPAQLFQRIQEKALEEHPEPKPPKKEIKVVDGTEVVDDWSNPDFVKSRDEAEGRRNRWASEKVLNYALKHCTDLDLDLHKSLIRDLEETLYAFPKEPLERKYEFLTAYVFRTQDDFSLLIMTTLRLMMITNPDVARRLEFFRREMEGAAAAGAAPETPGADEVERVDVSPQAEGA